MKKFENIGIPYFQTNHDWFETVFDENKGWQYKLTAAAPPEAIESYNNYLKWMENKQSYEDVDLYIEDEGFETTLLDKEKEEKIKAKQLFGV